jgi:hypothetical protein
MFSAYCPAPNHLLVTNYEILKAETHLFEKLYEFIGNNLSFSFWLSFKVKWDGIYTEKREFIIR